MPPTIEPDNAPVRVYGALWCPDTRRSLAFLAAQRIPYGWVDIDRDADGRRLVEALQQGGHTIPTIVFSDGSHLLEPSDSELASKLGVAAEARDS